MGNLCVQNTAKEQGNIDINADVIAEERAGKPMGAPDSEGKVDGQDFCDNNPAESAPVAALSPEEQFQQILASPPWSAEIQVALQINV